MFQVFSKKRIVAEPGFNRWKVPPASIAIHLCIGSVYAWSIFNPTDRRFNARFYLSSRARLILLR
jgi:hypothetical protein